MPVNPIYTSVLLSLGLVILANCLFTGLVETQGPPSQQDPPSQQNSASQLDYNHPFIFRQGCAAST